MLDYRKQSIGEINEVIGRFKNNEALREEVLNGLLKVAVWHSIKDGQITPAVHLLASVKGQKEQVSLYLTKFGNLAWSEKKGLHYAKYKAGAQSGLDKANEVFDQLPDLEEAFPSKPKQYRDMPFMSALKHIVKQAEEVQAAGRSVIFASDEEKRVFEEMKAIAKMAA